MEHPNEHFSFSLNRFLSIFKSFAKCLKGSWEHDGNKQSSSKLLSANCHDWIIVSKALNCTEGANSQGIGLDMRMKMLMSWMKRLNQAPTASSALPGTSCHSSTGWHMLAVAQWHNGTVAQWLVLGHSGSLTKKEEIP